MRTLQVRKHWASDLILCDLGELRVSSLMGALTLYEPANESDLCTKGLKSSPPSALYPASLTAARLNSALASMVCFFVLA